MRKFIAILILMPFIGFTQAFVDWSNYPGGVSVAADASNNVYSSYWDYNPAGDIYLTKRSAAGNVIWEVSYNNTDNSRHEVTTWVETDSQGNILVSGTIRSGYSNPVNANSLLMKFNPSGNLLWRNVWETDFDGSYTKKCIVDAQDNIYVLGTGHNGTSVVTKVKKFSPGGSVLWTYMNNDGIGMPINFKFTPDNGILISARAIYGSINGYAKLTKEGTHVWSYPGVNSLTIGDAAGDSEGNSYIVHGEYVSNGGTVIRKVSPSGSLIWENVYSLIAYRVEIGSDNQPVACGFPNSGSGGASFIKVNPSGGIVWANPDADGPLNLLLHSQLRMDVADNIYIAAGTLFEMAICKVNSNGTSAWTLTMSGSSTASGFDIGNDNNIYVVGGTTARIVQESHTTLSLKAFLDGAFNLNQMTTLLNSSGYIPTSQPYNTSPWFYSGTESVTSIPNPNIVDWVLLELRETSGNASTATPDKIIGRQAGFILKNGTITGTDGVSPLQFNLEITNNLFVVLWHRNHAGIMSADAVTKVNGIYTYDFTLVNKIFGGVTGGVESTPGIWAMAGGAGNVDYHVNNLDKNEIWFVQQNNPGYLSGDFNLNGIVDTDDKTEIWQRNIGKSSQVP
jgi:hypothetical protein